MLNRRDNITDLGVIFQSNLDFSLHINNLISRAFKKLSFLKRKCYDFTNEQTLKTLYFTLIRSTLEYCCVIWSPYYNNKCLSIEKVQNNFLRFLYYRKFNHCPFDVPSLTLQETFGVQPLKSRRDLCILMFFYRILNNRIDCSDILDLVQFSVNRRNLRSTNLFVTQCCKFNYIANFSLYKFYNLYNQFSHILDVFGMSVGHFRQTCINVLDM